MPKKNYEIVLVEWVDTEEKGESGWNDIKEMLRYAKKPCPVMRSVGFEVCLLYTCPSPRDRG